MGLFSTARRAADSFKGFGSDRKGGVALMVGLTFPMVFIGAGGALDYSNALTVTKQAQRAMDATVLALTRRDLGAINVQSEGDALFRAILQDQGVSAAPSETQFTLSDNVVRGSGIVGTKTFFLNFIGMNSVDGKVESAAMPPAERPIEIALVLDVSGSMSIDLNGKTRLAQMKESVGGMFDALDKELPTGAKLSASVIPYSTSVNLGDYPKVLKSLSVGGKNKPVAGVDVWAAERTLLENGTDITIDDSSPVGRPVPFVDSTEISSSTPTARLSALTDNIADVRTSVNGMTASGWTAGHIGMIWGVYTLSDKWANVWPQNPAKTGEADKIIVMLSDGKFNTTLNVGSGSTNDGATSDAYFQAVCKLAEQRGITVYTVALALDPVSEAKLGACVGSTGKLYTADSANELSKAFEDIARRLGTHRLTS